MTNKTFEEMMSNPTFFKTYNLALLTFIKSSQIINSYGADPKGMKLVVKALEILSSQMNKYSNTKVVEDTLQDLNIKLDKSKDNDAS